MALVSNPDRPGMTGGDRVFNRLSRKLDGYDPITDTFADSQLKQLKLIKTHLEVMNGEVLELSQNDDDDAGA